MTTIKSYSDLEQSKKLAEILPLESADNIIVSFGDRYGVKTVVMPKETLDVIRTPFSDIRETTMCWSLAALLDVLPKQFGRYTKFLGWFDDAWHCVYMDEDSECKYCVSADNPLDACYEMILKLHELNLL